MMAIWILFWGPVLLLSRVLKISVLEINRHMGKRLVPSKRKQALRLKEAMLTLLIGMEMVLAIWFWEVNMGECTGTGIWDLQKSLSLVNVKY